MKMEVTGFKGLFDSIGTLKKDLKPIPNTPLYDKLVLIATQLISQLKQSLSEETQSNSLAQSIAPEITAEGDNVSIVIKANSYWKFVNDGVNGLQSNVGSPYSFKTPYPNRKMAQALEKGMAIKGITLPFGFKDYKSFSYASSVKLKREGIKPNHFVDKVISEEFISLIQKELSEELGKIVTLSFKD